jgi:hypothetical protein
MVDHKPNPRLLNQRQTGRHFFVFKETWKVCVFNGSWLAEGIAFDVQSSWKFICVLSWLWEKPSSFQEVCFTQIFSWVGYGAPAPTDSEAAVLMDGCFKMSCLRVKWLCSFLVFLRQVKIRESLGLIEKYYISDWPCFGQEPPSPGWELLCLSPPIHHLMGINWFLPSHRFLKHRGEEKLTLSTSRFHLRLPCSLL